MIVIQVALIFVPVAIVIWIAMEWHDRVERTAASGSRGVLDERLMRGEITPEEHATALRALGIEEPPS